MAFIIWTVRNNYSIGVIPKSTYIDELLPISYNVNPSKVTFTIVSGRLPDGVVLLGDRLTGTPFNIEITTQFKFTIAASYENQSDTRTFYLTIKDNDTNIWTVNDGYSLGKIYGLMYVNIELPVRYSYVIKEQVDFTIVAGYLPDGLILKGDTIVGKMSSVEQIVDYHVVIRAIYNGQFFDRTFYLTVDMEKPVWNVSTGYDLGTIEERNAISLQLPINYGFVRPKDVTFSVIAGKLPNGILLIHDKLVGTPFEVSKLTSFEFVIRAEYNKIITDCTFLMSIIGNDDPVWLTPSGLLPIGINDTFFILDDSYVNFKLHARDYDSPTGEKLSFFIPSNSGELPPGLTLSDDGVISGWVQPTFDLSKEGATGWYDTMLYDDAPYDCGSPTSKDDIPIGNSNLNDIFDVINEPPIEEDSYGFDGYGFDKIIYDYTSDNIRLSKLNRNFEFKVIVTDGYTSVTRAFRIYVVGDDSYLTNNSYNIRKPEWITDSNLGITRANNYHTINISVYDKSYLGPVFYNLEDTNDDNSISILPPGMQFDPFTCKVIGKIPYQNAITKTYRFTLSASRLSPIDMQSTFNVVTSYKTFFITVIGELEAEIEWITGSDLGTIDADIVSNLYVTAINKNSKNNIYYSIIDGKLPHGLSLDKNGEIHGKPRQYNTNSDLGLTYFDNDTLHFDHKLTPIDRVFNFTILASDTLGSKQLAKQFTLAVATPNDRSYSNVYAKPFLTIPQRALYKDLITNSNIFVPEWIYRSFDKNFGIQLELKMLVFAGIETKTATEIVGALGRNHKRKRFILGNVNFAKAKNTLSQETIYEVVYIEVNDPLEPDDYVLNDNIFTSNQNIPVTIDQTNQYYNGPFDEVVKYNKKPSPFSVTIDRSDMFVGDSFTKIKQPSSISLWRKRIKELGLNDRQYLPLWMKSIPDNSLNYLDYISVIPICYCKPGYAPDIILNIKNYMKTTGLSFNQFDYDIDRYIIDKWKSNSLDENQDNTIYEQDKYFIFRNDRTTIR